MILTKNKIWLYCLYIILFKVESHSGIPETVLLNLHTYAHLVKKLKTVMNDIYKI